MKSFKTLFLTIAAVALTLVACSKKGVDTSALESSFKSADATSQTAADSAASAIKSGDYSAGLSKLQSLASNAKLTPEQQSAIKDLIAKVQQAITDAVSKAAGEPGKAASDATKSLPSLK